ncbi:MAG TPA: hypothetical protein EYP77_01175 [Anaerolineae bacterium]|nr:hypothetical protein [Anaerolineae bacterium]
MSVQVLTIRLLGLRVTVSVDRTGRSRSRPQAADSVERAERHEAHRYPGVTWEVSSLMTMWR